MSEENKPTPKTYTQEEFDRERAYAQRAEAQVEEYKNRFKDIDPDKYKQTTAELEALKKKGAVGDEKAIEELLRNKEAELEKRYQTKLSELEDGSQKLANELKRERVTKVVLSKAAPHMGEDMVDVMETVIDREGDLLDGRVVFKGPDGKPRYSKEKPAELLSTEEYVAELKGRYPSAFKSEAIPGGRPAAERTNGASVAGVNSLADAKRLPDKGAAAFQEMAKTPEGRAKLHSILS